MTDITSAPINHSKGFDWLHWSWLCFAIAIVGFVPTFFMPIAQGDFIQTAPSLPVHVAASYLWCALFVIQPWLIRQARQDVHRMFGVFALLVGLVAGVTGFQLQFEVMPAYVASDNLGDGVITPFFRFATMAAFVGLVLAGAMLRKKSDWHKRLMLTATLFIIEAPLARFCLHGLDLGESSGLVAAIIHMAMMVAFLFWDRSRLGFIHPATAWCTGLTFVLIFLPAPVAFSGWWEQMVRGMIVGA